MKTVKTTWQRVREISLLGLTSLLQEQHFHLCFRTATVIVRTAFRKGLAEVGSLNGRFRFSSSPLSASLCNEGAQSNRHP